MAVRLDQIPEGPIRLDQVPEGPTPQDQGPIRLDQLPDQEPQGDLTERMLGGATRGMMQVGRAALGAPATAVRQASLVAQWAQAEDVLREKDPQRQTQLLKSMSESKKSFDATADMLGEAQDWHKQGMQSIIRNHPEWKSDPPESFLDLLTNPDKLAVSLAEAMPILISAGVLMAAGQPQVATGLMYVSEGQQASDQTIADGGSEDDAAIAYFIYGLPAAVLEKMQLEGIIKVAKGSYNALLNRTVQKVAKGGLRTAVAGTIKIAATEALEEMTQGAWGEITAKMVYDKDIPGGVADFIDRRAQEAYIGGVMGLIPGVAGGVAGRVQARQATLDPQIIAEQVVERADIEIDPSLPPEEQEIQVNKLIEEQIVGNIQTRKKIISKFPQNITDAKSLKEVGDKIAKELGIESPKQWTFEHKIGKEAITGYNSNKGERIHIIQGGKVHRILGKTSINWAWNHFGLEVKVGDKIYPSQAMLKRAIIHELLHTPQAREFTPTGRRRVHPKSFKEAVQKNVKSLFTTKIVPVPETPVVAKVPVVEEPVTEAPVVEPGRSIITDQAIKEAASGMLGEPTPLPITKDLLLEQDLVGPVPAEAKAPPKPKRITRKKALALGHTLPEILEWDEAQRRDFMQQTIGKTSMKDMKLAEMRTLVEALQGEVQTAGLEYTPETPPVDELVETLQAKKVTELEPAEELKAGKIRQLGRRIKAGTYSFVTGLERMERFFESLDRHKRGAFTENIWKPVQQADELSTENTNQDFDEFQGYLAEQDVDTALWLGKMEDIGRWSLTPFQKVGTYMLAQNKNGRRQLTQGMGMSEGDLAQIMGAMTPQEIAVADWLLEKYDQQWEVIKVVAVQSGMDPTKLKKELHYSPIMRTDADLETQEDFLSGLSDAFTGEKYNPERKFLEPRKRGARGKVELDAAILYMHNIARTQRFLQMAPVAHRIGRILNDKKFKQALNERTYGQGSKLVNKWMKDAVRGTVSQSTTALSKMANIMRRNGIVYAIGYNIPSSLRQSLSLSNAVAVDKAMLAHVPANLARAAIPKGYREMEEFVFSRSLQVKNSSFDRDLRTKANKAGLKLKLRGKRQWSQKAISWIRWMDKHTRVVAWKSLYDTGMGKFNDEIKASEYADKWVSRTQPMANTKDLPHFFRGGTFEKLLTTFQNQVNNNANFYMYDILGAKKAGEISLTEAGHRVMFSYVLPAILFGMIGRGGLPKDIKDVVVDLATYPIAGVVVIGRWITAMIRGWGSSSTIAEIGPEEAGKLVGAVKRGDLQDIIKYAATTVGAATGRIPAQAVRTAEGVIDIATGETQDPRRLIYSEWALAQGKKEKKRTKYSGGYILP